MNAVYLTHRGGPEALTVGTVEKPKAGAGEVVVRVRAAAVTRTELHWVPTWTTPDGDPRPLPVIPGHEFSGTVDALGEGVSGLDVGDAVYGMNDWYINGAQAEFVRASASAVAPAPRSLDLTTAAAVPISALTAWQGLMERAKIQRGDRVLIHGAAGSVGLFAVQIARLAGACVIATASEHNLDFVRNLGADEVIDYRVQPFESVATDVDVVFDTVGGETLARSWRVLRGGGRMVTIVSTAEQTEEARVRDAFFIVEPDQDQLRRIAQLIDAGDLRPMVGWIFPLADARQAYLHKPIRGKDLLAL